MHSTLEKAQEKKKKKTEVLRHSEFWKGFPVGNVNIEKRGEWQGKYMCAPRTSHHASSPLV